METVYKILSRNVVVNGRWAVGWWLKVKVKSLSHVQLCDRMDCSLPGSSVHGISQARVLEGLAISFSGDLCDPGIEPTSFVLADGLFTK